MIPPPPRRTPAEWAAAHRPRVGTPSRPGWLPEVAPWLDEVGRAIADPLVEQVTLVCGTQMSKTEGVALNAMGWTLMDRPVPIIYVGPTRDTVGNMSKDDRRFVNLVRSVPELEARVDPRSHMQTSFERRISGVRVRFAWAGSDSQVAADPAGLVVVDEYDKMPEHVLELAHSRVKTYNPSTVIVISTPTWEGDSNIWQSFDEGSRERWFWRCPSCRAWFYPRRELLTWNKELHGLELEESAGVACDACGEVLRDEQRDGLEARWFPTRKATEGDEDDDQVDELAELPADERLDIAPRTAHRSFAVSGLCSWSQTVGKVAERLHRAERSGNQLRIKEVVNEQLGETYRVHGDTPGWRAVWNRREDYTRPPEGRFVTIGVDVAADRVDYVVRLWGAAEESWLLEAGELHGSTLLDDVFVRLQTDVIRKEWGWPVRMVLVDAQYRPASVWRLAERLPRLVWPVIGEGEERAKARDKRYWKARPEHRPDGTPNQRGMKVWHVDVSWFKGWLYGKIRGAVDEPGAWHVPRTITRAYARQVTNEELVDTGKGLEWKKTGDRQNHKLDCEVYATAAAWIRGAPRIRPRAKRDEEPPPATPAPSSPAKRRRGRFARRQL